MSEQRLKSRRNCDMLGVCQQHQPPCKGCTVVPIRPDLRLAPGVLEGYRVPFFGTPAQRRELLRWVLLGALWAGVSGVTAFLAGVMARVL